MAYGQRRRFWIWFRLGLLLAPACAPVNLRAHGDLEARIAALSNTLATNSSHAELFFQRAELYRLHDQQTLALGDYRRVLELDPSIDAARLGMSEALLKVGNPVAARAMVETFLEKHSANPEALLVRAQILTAMGKKLEAVADYSKALSAVSRPAPEIYLERAALLTENGKVEEAIAGLDEGVKRLGHVPPLELRAVELELGRARPDAALARLDEQIARAHRKEFLFCRRATVLEKLERWEAARASYQAGLDALNALAPEQRNVPAVRALGQQIEAALARLDDRGRHPASLQGAHSP